MAEKTTNRMQVIFKLDDLYQVFLVKLTYNYNHDTRV